MRTLLGREFDAYREELEKEAYHGIRFNTGKLSLESRKELFPEKDYGLERIPWTRNGYYFEQTEEFTASKHPLYHAGLYYLQDPSAMAPAQLLPVTPGDRVLDLCAAPGGKSTELGARLCGEGILVANDISMKRAKALLKNVELFGLTNAIVLNETPDRLVEHFGAYFNKILVDAPCSGEGMFRKDAAMMKNWEEKGVEFYCGLQREILDAAVKLLAPGGMLLYSTCTFSPEEDEANVQRLLLNHPELSLAEISLPEEAKALFDHGHPEWVENGREELRKCARLWPHRLKGEGHFLALFQKAGGEKVQSGELAAEKSQFRQCSDFNEGENHETGKDRKKEKRGKKGNTSREQKQKGRRRLAEPVEEFLTMLLPSFPMERYELVSGNENIYLIPKNFPSLRGLHVVRSGILLGTVKTFQQTSFEPSQMLALCLKKEDFSQTYDFGENLCGAMKYLRGESFETEEKLNGYVLICVKGFPLGWGKASKGRIKNKYSKSWRM